MSVPGKFFGIGVGPGEPGLMSVIAWESLKRCDVIFVPRARTREHSVARRCLPANEIPNERFREVEFTMDSDRNRLREHYASLAETIAAELRAGKDAAWLTIGDPMTYSTYIYALAALKDRLSGLPCRDAGVRSGAKEGGCERGGRDDGLGDAGGATREPRAGGAGRLEHVLHLEWRVGGIQSVVQCLTCGRLRKGMVRMAVRREDAGIARFLGGCEDDG